MSSVFFVSISFVECKTVSEESPDTYHGAETQKHNQKLEHSEYFPVEVETVTESLEISSPIFIAGTYPVAANNTYDRSTDSLNCVKSSEIRWQTESHNIFVEHLH